MTHPDVIPEAEFIDSTDAMLWARAMSSRIRAQLVLDPADEGWLVGWFANAMAAQERALQVVPARIATDDPLTNAVADLADAMTGVRELVEREEARMRQRDADEDARDGRRDAAAWEEALGNLLASLRGAVHMVNNAGGIVPEGAERPDEHKLADALVAEIDRRLRGGGGWSLQQAFRTLGGRPPKDLRAEAEQYAGRIVGSPEARSAAVEAYLAGAGVER